MATIARLILNAQIGLGLLYLAGSWFQIVPFYQVYALVCGLCLVPLQLLAVIQASRARSRGNEGPTSPWLYLLLAVAGLHMYSMPGGDVSSQPDWVQARFAGMFFVVFGSVQRAVLQRARYL